MKVTTVTDFTFHFSSEKDWMKIVSERWIKLKYFELYFLILFYTDFMSLRMSHLQNYCNYTVK